MHIGISLRLLERLITKVTLRTPLVALNCEYRYARAPNRAMAKIRYYRFDGTMRNFPNQLVEVSGSLYSTTYLGGTYGWTPSLKLTHGKRNGAALFQPKPMVSAWAIHRHKQHCPRKLVKAQRAREICKPNHSLRASKISCSVNAPLRFFVIP